MTQGKMDMNVVANFIQRNAAEKPNFMADCHKWERLNILGESLGLEPMSERMACFVAAGMSSDNIQGLDALGEELRGTAVALLVEHKFIAKQ